MRDLQSRLVCVFDGNGAVRRSRRHKDAQLATAEWVERVMDSHGIGLHRTWGIVRQSAITPTSTW